MLVPHSLDPAKGMALARVASSIAGVPVIISDDLEADLPAARALLYVTQS